jgi:hypothetical protein
MAATAVVAAGTAPRPGCAQAAGPLAGSEAELAAWCLALAGGGGPLSAPERRLVRALAGAGAGVPAVAPCRLDALRQAIRAGADPLGDAFMALRPAAQRRATGAVYTPPAIVRAMTAWLAAQAAQSGQRAPARIVDPGAGSGRFLLAAAAAFPAAQLVAVEADPLAALMLRANLQVQGCAARAAVLVQDYRSVRLPACGGATAFIGNPPYLRHHGIEPRWKAWYTAGCAGLGIRASALAGLHLHFFLQTRLLARPGDVGAFITSAEWLDVNYGAALRRLLLDQLGGVALHVLEPALQAFAGTAATAAIACFRVGETAAPVRVRSVAHLADLADLAGPDALAGGTRVARARLQATPRWSAIVRPPQRPAGGDIELGEMFRVHRGQVTGANGVWIAAAQAAGLPGHLQLPCITRARELIAAGASLPCASALRRVIDLPADLDVLAPQERRRVEAFLAWARAQGAHQGYVARHRQAWWAVGLRAPAPILCTYMARRPPQFTVNSCAARHINVAHGLYPRQPLPPGAAQRLVDWLNQHTGTDRGRTYAGGLTKFEPKEIERLRIPALAALAG